MIKIKEFIKNKIPKRFGEKIIRNKICGVCLEKNEILYTDILSNNFTNYDLVPYPYICSYCCSLFNEDYRKKSFYISEKESKLVQQNEIADIIRNITFPSVLSFTESHKKHRLYKAKINTNKENFIVTVDDGYVSFNLNEDVQLMDYLENFYNQNKVSKKWITGEMPSNVIQKIGFYKYFELQNKIKKYKNLPQLSLLVSFINNNDGQKI